MAKMKNMTEEIEIRKVEQNETDTLREIGIRTFYETFAEFNSKEDMDAYLSTSFSLEKVTDELKNKASEFYFAIFQHEIIGYLKINFSEAQTELKAQNALEIERIYVLKEFHGKKVGQILYEKAIQIAKTANADYVWLGVWERNLRAISFYKKNGFVEFDTHVFKLGNDIQTDIMMKMELK